MKYHCWLLNQNQDRSSSSAGSDGSRNSDEFGSLSMGHDGVEIKIH